MPDVESKQEFINIQWLWIFLVDGWNFEPGFDKSQ